MTAEPDEPASPPPRPRRRRRVAVALGVLLGSAIAGTWLVRVPIATGVIDRELARRHVPARYRVADLGLGRQRLTNVVIGDPARPDLVADWLETQTDLTAGGPRVVAVRAGRVRMAARWRDGRVSLGVIDRLLPAPSGAPFALPAIDVAVGDARIRLETPAGVVGVRIAGQGRLNDGFRGQVAAVAPLLAASGCRASDVTLNAAIRIRAAAPDVRGLAQAGRIVCTGAIADQAQVDLHARLSPSLDRWRGAAELGAATLRGGGAQLAGLRGSLGFDGDPRRTGGSLRLAAGRFAAAPLTGGAATAKGMWRVGGGRAILAGTVQARHMALSEPLRRRIARAGEGAAATPVAPLLRGGARDLARAAADLSGSAELAVATGATTLVTVKRAALSAPGGERLRFGEGGGIVIGHPAGMQVDGTLRTGGGGMPRATLRLAQARPGGPIGGSGRLHRYARNGAALSLSQLAFSTTPGGAARVRTVARVSGPLPGGRVEEATAPLDVQIAGGRLAVNPVCTPVALRAVQAGGLRIGATRLTLCPVGPALLTLADGRVGGGVRIAAPRVAGRLGDLALLVQARSAEARLADGRLTLAGLAVRLGAPERQTRLDVERLDGGVARGGMSGAFAGAAGQIGAVPLLLDRADGRWSFRDGTLDLAGALRVADAQADAPRFQPMAAQQVALRLRDGTIHATAALLEPTRARKVADVTIDHALASGTGAAHLAVPGIAFGDGFQPDLLTRATFGVVADVKGMVRGAGDIRWDAAGVTSTGSFSTDGTDLAAAFGPVTGVKGTIRFTDLLALESAPAQEVTIASVNPGVPVENGRVTYRTLADSRVQVDGGAWPFAGGTLTLEPTLLDFSAARTRRMTFRVEGMQAARFLEQFDFENLDATGIFDGELPMLFDESGGRIEGGHLTARAPGGGIAYVGELTQKQLGFWGDFAFQALKSLTYRELAITMNGPLAGEMVTQVRFAGIRQGKGAESNFLVRRLTRLPVVFNVNIRAPFRGLIDSAASFYDPSRLVQRNLRALIDEQNRREGTSIQPPASETVP